MRRGWVRAVARGLVGVVVLAQLAIAAYACPALSAATAANAQVSAPEGLAVEPGTAQAGTPMAGGANCDDMTGGSVDPAWPNLCAEHCKVGQQSDQAQTITVPTAVLTPLYATPLVPETALPSRPAAATMSALVAASPPHAILHCVFRI
jgi:hypothetical protein